MDKHKWRKSALTGDVISFFTPQCHVVNEGDFDEAHTMDTKGGYKILNF
jgi:hypothetical protein